MQRDTNDNRSSAKAGDDDPTFVLQVTLGDMDPEDAFRVSLPSSFARLPAGELFERLFGEDEQGQAEIRALFDLRENPDLPEMYGSLLEIFRAWRGGRCSLRLLEGGGVAIEPSAETREYCVHSGPQDHGGPPGGLVFPVVVEQRFRPLDYVVEQGYWESKRALLDWLEERVLLYFMDLHDFRLKAEPASQADRRLLPIAGRLSTSGLLAADKEGGDLAIAEQGRIAIADMIEEAASYLSAYGVFADVLYDEESETVEFDTGRGEDLMVQVFEAEGIDPARAEFLLALYGPALDDLDSDWREAVHEEAFFEELLTPVADHFRVDGSVVERIVESGFAHLEEREEESSASISDRELLARARRL